MKRILLCIILLVGCVTTPQVEVSKDALCEWNEGWEYVCYDKKECMDFIKGYGLVLRERFMAQKRGWFTEGENPDVQRVNINLFMDELGLYLYGFFIGTRHNDRVYIDTTSWMCDIEGNVVAPVATLGGWAEWRLE